MKKGKKSSFTENKLPVKFSEEVKMGERQELKRELAEWTVKWVEAENCLKDFLPAVRVEEHIKPAELQDWVLTKEKWVEFQRIEKEIEEALDKQLEILDKLSRLE